jgi:hypothetical protein
VEVDFTNFKIRRSHNYAIQHVSYFAKQLIIGLPKGKPTYGFTPAALDSNANYCARMNEMIDRFRR